MTFGLFFLGEYANMILMSGIGPILFLGGWLPIIDVAPFNWIPGIFWFLENVRAAVRLPCGCARRCRATAMTS